MDRIKRLFENNRTWAAGRDPATMRKLADKQTPQYLWIGCADSRVPPNEILGLEPGEIFVHRNIANLFLPTDFNCLSVLEYAVDVLKIEEVIVCGHYGCGGVAAAMQPQQSRIMDNWLHPIRDTAARIEAQLDAINNDDARCAALVEYNVVQQVHNICHTPIIQKAWKHDHPVTVYGWVYDMKAGLIKDLNCSASSADEANHVR